MPFTHWYRFWSSGKPALVVTTTSNGAGHRRHGEVPGGLAGGGVLGEEVAGEHLDDPVSPIEEHVEGEVDTRGRRDGADRVMHGVADGHTPRGPRVTDAAGVVESEHGLEAGEPGRHHLRARR